MTEEVTPCTNQVIDAARTVLSAMGKETTCDKAKGYVYLIVGVFVVILILKFFVLKR